jgi:hypothetical protein
MSRMDYTDIIAEIVQPSVVDNVVVAKMEKLNQLFTQNNTIKSGSRITDDNIVAETSAGGAYTRADANPASMTQTFAIPYWNKLYYHEAGKIRREDLDEAREGTPLVNLLTDTATKITKQLFSHVYSGALTQIKSDVDSTGAYSDASTTRVTALASYEEATDATITLSYLRGATKAIALKDEIDWSDYVWLVEQTVLNTAWPLMSETGSWVEQNPAGRAVAAGYLPVATFDGVAVDTSYGMTTGDVFLLNRNDVQIQTHKPLEIEMVAVDEYAYKMVARIGVNAWVRRPAFQGKLTSKD